MKKVLLKIDGMTCSACSSGLEKFLNKQDGIATASVNLIMNNASIEYAGSDYDFKIKIVDTKKPTVKLKKLVYYVNPNQPLYAKNTKHSHHRTRRSWQNHIGGQDDTAGKDFP